MMRWSAATTAAAPLHHAAECNGYEDPLMDPARMSAEAFAISALPPLTALGDEWRQVRCILYDFVVVL